MTGESKPDYPDQWEADVVLADGGTAHLRPIRPADADLLRSFYARLSAETIYYRFFSPRPHLSDREIQHFTTVDYDRRVGLIATIGGDMVAVVRYDRLTDRPGTAEVAFLVEDAHQGRGLGPVLLEHIAAAARERGLHRFVASVLPDNRRMTRVFREAGYRAEQRFEDGVIELVLDLEPTETSVEVTSAREHRAEARSIQRLMTPHSVAVVGASRAEHSVGQTVLRNLLGGDFSGPVYPVHPTATAVAGVRAYASVLDIPDDVDLAVVAVRANTVHEVVEQCASKGVHGLVVVSSGFGEAGPEGRARQEELVRLARAYGMRVVGPNCLGIANTDPNIRLNATLAPTLPGRGPVGFFSQSGALGTAILQRTAERGLGLSTFVSAGNRADVSGNDLMQYWEEDPATKAVLLYLESLGNPRKFARLARRLSRRKPIVAVKSGRSTQGVPLGHAARALSLPDHAVSALFAQAGVIRVDDLSELFDVAQLLAYQPLPAGDRIAIIDNSDSLGLLAQDAAVALGLRVRPPVDLGPLADADAYEEALATALRDENVDAVVALFTPPTIGGYDLRVPEKILRLAAGSSKPIVATYLGSKGMPGDLRINAPDGSASAGSVPSYPAPEDAVRALAYVIRYAQWRQRPPGRIPDLVTAEDRRRARALVGGWLEAVPADGAPVAASRAQAAELLACYGIHLAEPEPSAEGPAGGEAAGPVGGGAAGPVGGATEGALEAAEEDCGGSGVPVRIVTSEDASFGAVVAFGLADETAALLDDRAYRLAPLTDAESAAMVRAVRTAPLLLGHRGAEPVDVSALEDLLQRVAKLGDDLPEVARLELDPVIADASGVSVRGVRLRLQRPMGPRPELGPRRLG
ncbi:bifunctional acetate--CoA ligase family protein/GNAT family N-acetyltransferase [Actinomadura rupiterrae]|uniref:bifunctional acetate--CoA ligase family protein/GNAT family N-acetyltransferase n=1 Tax=Actinomadura rupiterrae TaxID=559627 RepID=UPI0020A2789E|nr:GNAT family N-acetyltransferase [Actinomadura rupiterrae]MCP2335707.1 acyl-CoA synthetase (NDP forming)/RimJ/RimL family protein N-acetyltransferase [Actinomadura rupiterrae]